MNEDIPKLTANCEFEDCNIIVTNITVTLLGTFMSFDMDIAEALYHASPMETNPSIRKLKIVEINNFNSAGWYKCDVSKIVQAIEGL